MTQIKLSMKQKETHRTDVCLPRGWELEDGWVGSLELDGIRVYGGDVSKDLSFQDFPKGVKSQP